MRGATMTCRLVHATAPHPGAIAILQLLGDSREVLRELTGELDWPLHRTRLVSFAGIDRGLAVRLTEQVAHLMPHGGPRVVQQLTAKLLALGVELRGDAVDDANDPIAFFPEATDRIEALMMLALAGAESPLAIDLLLDQPWRWRELRASGRTLGEVDRQRSLRLTRLISPPVVVLAGRPNVGKSTLSNALLGREMSIALDMPGTTRDYTAGRIDLGGLVVDWHDTPGLRATNDAIERRAIDLAQRLIDRADLLIAMRDPGSDWPELTREADVWVMNKMDTTDRVSRGKAKQLCISARVGTNVSSLASAVRERLVPQNDLDHPGPWLFDARLLA